MPAKIRSVRRQFNQQYTPLIPNLLVAGCSYTWNNSEDTAVTWPYYLRDIAGFDQVFDCSQSGTGANLSFSSVVNELESNQNLTPQNTLVIIMWSELTRTDIIAPFDLVDQVSNMETHVFDADRQLSALSLFNTQPEWSKHSEIEKLRKQHILLISDQAKVFDSLLKIIATHNYLQNRKFKSVFLRWEPWNRAELINNPLVQKVQNLISPVESLGAYTNRSGTRIPNDGHPTPDSQLNWSKDVLIPYLVREQLVNKLN
jgi:hypothetical protein